MKKRKNMNIIEKVPNQNPVAKFAHQFNKAQVFDDKSKYNRKEKHAKQEVSPSTQKWADRETPCQFTFGWVTFVLFFERHQPQG